MINFYSAKKPPNFAVLCFVWFLLQYQVGQLFSVAEASKNETGGGEGIQVLKNEPYEVKGEKGQYTHKLYHIKRYVCWFVFPLVVFLSPHFLFQLQLHNTASRWQCWLFLKKGLFQGYSVIVALFMVDGVCVLSQLCISPLSFCQ